MRITSIGQGEAAMPAWVYAEPDELGRAVARRILQGIAQAKRLGRAYLLGCPSGRSPRPVYEAMGELAASGDADFSHLVIVMMDDYVEGSEGAWRNCPAEAHYSCRRFALVELRDVINRQLPADRQLPRANVWTPDPADPQAYHDRIAEAGGIDLFILASGASDGHVAFNAPGSTIDSPARVMKLADATRRDNLGTFPQFESIDEVPTHGVTVGIRTIVELSRSVALVIHGEHKHEAVRRLHGCSGFDVDWPVSCATECLNAVAYLDEAAGKEL